MEQRFANAAGEAVGNEDDQCEADDEDQRLAPVLIAEQDVEENRSERNPCAGGGYREEHVVEIDALAAVEKQEQLLVEMYEVVKHGVDDFYGDLASLRQGNLSERVLR